MSDIQIARGRESKRLLHFGSMLFGIFVLANLLGVSIVSRIKAAREPNARLQESFLELASVALILGILFSFPAFLCMVFFKRLRCVQYIGAIIGFGIVGAGILGCVYYNVDMNPDPFPWRPHVLEDTLRGVFGGFQLGLFAGSCLAPFALLVLPGKPGLPQGFGDNEEYLSSDRAPPEIGSAEDTAIRKPW